ncbi:DNA-directed RNA polymerase I and III 14 KDA polypeptide [Aspergillus japonicus CBS 114.51]|uniref:DNA-directed RNA polymerase I and III 14 kDa polypeptide n=2 Tax=Aspergillus TaxID=5052 RepID=A0A2V5HHI5_ASPV1|nr:DNA-directed RNA polymerase I and III 14 KDA polypeptide [Aspergillus japonicus CBS 114.51]PYI23251.1 DNA-directed RNA polymerase I and III 14 KDA polypeptide [Aspergillus violaceofuscus CBS 115571]RAH80236.1 DNA-directed RNA polymerase I and III 14 KDA polypeptide [Aspergillus japonicus CBS 114.51]
MPGSLDQENDQSMMDAAPEQQHEQDDVLELEDKRIVVLPGATETAASFQFDGEGHTLGNALRYAIMKNPQVEFCGYTIPHPSETKMNLRIQTYDSTTAVEALEKGLDTLMDLCDVVTDKFTVARDEFNASKVDRMEL